MYDQVQAESRVPKLERELENVRVKWSMLVKEHASWVVDAKKMKKLEADMTKIEKVMSKLRSIH